MVNSKFVMDTVAIVTVFVNDCGDVDVIVKLSKLKWSNAMGKCKEAVTKTVNSNKNL